MHLRLSANFPFRRFDLPLGPSLHRLPPQEPHLLDDPLFGRVRLLEVSLRILYGNSYRCDSVSKIRMRVENGQKRLVAEFHRCHLLSLGHHRFASVRRITLNRTLADLCLGKMLDKAKNRGELRPYLRNLNVRWFDFDLSDVAEMRFEEHEHERYSAKAGDVLICEGGYPGRAAIWSKDFQQNK